MNLHRLSAMDRVKFHLKFRRNFGLERNPSQRRRSVARLLEAAPDRLVLALDAMMA